MSLATRYSCLRAKDRHLFWNSDHQPIKSIVFDLSEKARKVLVAGKVIYQNDLTIDYRIGYFVNSGGSVLIFLRKWERMPQELIDRFCMNFHVNLLQVRACGGDNRFNG